jgi:stage III sporulation protein AF
MEGLAQYVLRLVMLTIVFSVLEILLPSGAIRKFGALAVGIVLLFSAVAPVIEWLGTGAAEDFAIGSAQTQLQQTDTGINREMTPYE